jgi:hypothetical protein
MVVEVVEVVVRGHGDGRKIKKWGTIQLGSRLFLAWHRTVLSTAFSAAELVR